MPAPQIRIEKELAEGRVFIAALGMQVDVHVSDDGINVRITRGNDVLSESWADREDPA